MGEMAAGRSIGAPPAAGEAPTRYARPMVAVDTVVFAVHARALKTYLVQLRHGPSQGRWAFPGGLVQVGELLDQAAYRELRAATGLDCPYMEQLCTFGDPSRDPRAHVVSVAYMALLPAAAEIAAPQAKYTTGGWFDMAEELPPLAYDHSLMARYALARLAAKLTYTNIAVALLPERFSFAELEELYAAILGRCPDRRNFRRRIMAMNLLRRLPESRRGPHRPAALYSFVNRVPQVVEML